ncbi:MAG: hypothetical protein KC620_22780, partial [Myxococcales bacterium]|nr:hypothetical protein [Myxococcales bacterium]
MRPATLLRRAGHGLGLLTMLAAAVVPLFATIAATHRGHWAGVGALDFWPGFVVPWAGRTWAVVLLVALAGWAASAAPAEPHRGRRALIGGGTGGAAAIICALAALPGWVWLARLGAADASAL